MISNKNKTKHYIHAYILADTYSSSKYTWIKINYKLIHTSASDSESSSIKYTYIHGSHHHHHHHHHHRRPMIYRIHLLLHVVSSMMSAHILYPALSVYTTTIAWSRNWTHHWQVCMYYVGVYHHLIRETGVYCRRAKQDNACMYVCAYNKPHVKLHVYGCLYVPTNQHAKTNIHTYIE